MLKLFYHIHTTGDQYADMFFVDEQLKRLQYSELIDAASCYAVVTGPAAEAVWILVDRSRKFRILEYCDQAQDIIFEGRTLRHLYTECTEDDTIVYMHTKGISYLLGQRTVAGSFSARHFKAINGWRDTMEHYIIDCWQQRLECEQWHTQGCMLKHNPWPHYMGNMWWAKGSYIRSLPDPLTFNIIPYDGMQFEETRPERMRYEQWLLLNPGMHIDIHSLNNPVKTMPGYTTEFSPYEDDVSDL
jgi:hypothetical protein